MSAEDLLTEERRARMAAERLLKQKEGELSEANRMLSKHARGLSEDLVETREEVVEVRTDLERVNHEVDIAKRRLWTSLETVEDGFAIFDAESRLVIANPAYFAPFDGLACIRPGAHYEEIVEAAVSEGLVDIGERSRAEWRDWMLTRWTSNAPEPREIRLWNGAYVRLVDRRAPGGDTVSMGLDITASIRRQKLLRDARNRAEAANRAKSAFLANMSHEIRTPMNGVMAMADLMAEYDLDEDLQEYVETIRTSGRALLTIINDVLDYSKLEASKMTIHEDEFDLEKIILDVIALLMPSVRESGLSIMLDYDMFLATRFIGDPVRVRQVLTNLIGNAVKFTTEGHVLVRVLGLPEDDGKSQRIHLTVEDTGIGISPEHQAHVFGEFNQVEDERNRKFEGTGLGLAITRQLVELMGGEIWVESELGVGSAFGVSLTLPVIEEEVATELPHWLKRALLVMSEDMNRSILAKRLIALGISVDVAESKEFAQDKAAQADVIFVDYKVADGQSEACCAAQAQVIVVADPHIEGNRAPKGTRLLQKPHSRPALIKMLSELPEPTPAAAPGFRSRRTVEPAPENLFAESEAETETEIEAETGAATPVPAPTPAAAPPEPAVAAPTEAAPTATTPEAPALKVAPNVAVTVTPKPATPAQPTSAAVTPPMPEASPAQPPAAPTPEVTTAPRQMRVLVAEDNKTNRFVFSKLVKACDIDLIFAEDGFKAVEAFEEHNPDLVFMDISMPGMDGKEATRTIRTMEEERGLPRTRIVALTAHAMTGDGEEIMGHGLDAHLTKPFPKDKILAEIASNCPEEARQAVPEMPEKPAQAAV